MDHSDSTIEATINEVGRLYRNLTGHDAPTGNGVYAPIPPEKNPERYVEEQLDRLLGMLMGPTGGARPTQTWTPRVSVWEGRDEALLCLDLPGVTRDQIDITVVGQLLVVSGQRASHRGEAAGEYRLRGGETPHGAFRRALVLPSGVNVDTASASLKHGVLEIRLPRSPGGGGAGKTIQVQ